jgi:hypothetical protein
MREKLALVGSGPKTRELAPFKDNTYDIWVYNEAVKSPWCTRFDGSFQMHLPESYTAPENFKCPDYWQWMQEAHGKPVFMQAPDDRVPDCEVYPLEEIADMCGLRNSPELEKDYFLTGTVAMSLALGVYKGYKEIVVYGIEMSYTEYQYQAEMWRFWVGFCLGRGIKLTLYSGAHMFKSRLYGYHGNHTFPSEFFQARADKHDAERQAADKNLRGMQRTIDKLLVDREIGKFMEKIGDLQGAAMLAGQLTGFLAEAEKYAGYTASKPADRGEFEFSAALNQQNGEKMRIKMFNILGQIEYVWNVWNQTKDDRARDTLKQMAANLVTITTAVGKHHGAYTENVFYMHEYDEMYSAEGGQIGSTPRNVRL